MSWQKCFIKTCFNLEEKLMIIKAKWQGYTVTVNTGIKDAADIRPDNPAFFHIRYPAGYQIARPDDIQPDIR
jgi:hypothetical protein